MKYFYRITFESGEILEYYKARRYLIDKHIKLHRPDKVVSVERFGAEHFPRRHRQSWRAECYVCLLRYRKEEREEAKK